MRSSTSQLRLSALAVAATLALGATACGDSDDDGANGGNGGSVAGDSEEQRARATVDALYSAIGDGDAEGVCDQLAESAQKQVAAGGLGGKSDSCGDSFQKFLDQAEKRGGLNLTLEAKVKSVEVKGDQAVAKVSFGKGRNGEIPLTKVDGEWKLDAVGAAPAN
jgi:hypothetical protein